MTAARAARRVVADPRPPRPQPVRSRRRSSHDPFRPSTRMHLPQLPDHAEPVDRTVTVLAYVDRYPPEQNAGAEWMLHHLLRDSVERGHRALIATATKRPYEIEGVEVHPVRDAQGLAGQADVMISHLAWTHQAEEVADSHQVPLVYVLHNDQQVRFWRLTHHDLTVLVANSEWVAARNAGWKGLQVVVRPPVFVADYETGPPPAERTHVTLVNVYPEKGSGLFYRLARAMPDRRFLGVEGAYGNQRRPSPQDRNVDWQPQTGQITRDVYARTRVLLVPSSYESWGRVAVEAMCSGIPVIAHPTPGLREALGDAGIFADRDDQRAWRQALADLDDPDLYEKQSQASRQRAAVLDAQSRADLDTWDHTVRLAAGARPARRTP